MKDTAQKERLMEYIHDCGFSPEEHVVETIIGTTWKDLAETMLKEYFPSFDLREEYFNDLVADFFEFIAEELDEDIIRFIVFDFLYPIFAENYHIETEERQGEIYE